MKIKIIGLLSALICASSAFSHMCPATKEFGNLMREIDLSSPVGKNFMYLKDLNFRIENFSNPRPAKQPYTYTLMSTPYIKIGDECVYSIVPESISLDSAMIAGKITIKAVYSLSEEIEKFLKDQQRK